MAGIYRSAPSVLGMSLRTRRIAAASFAVLALWMIYTLFSGPTYEFEQGYGSEDDNPAFDMRCEPLLWRTSWGISWHASDPNPTHRSYTITSGLEPRSEAFMNRERQRRTAANGGTEETQLPDLAELQDSVDPEMTAALNEICTNGRTGQAGLLALAAVPASILGAVAILARRPRREPDENA